MLKWHCEISKFQLKVEDTEYLKSFPQNRGRLLKAAYSQPIPILVFRSHEDHLSVFFASDLMLKGHETPEQTHFGQYRHKSKPSGIVRK